MFISYRTMATLMLCLVASVAHAADAPACDLAGPARTVTRIAQLPPEVQSLLLENGPVSDPGSPFNASDVFIVDDPTPGHGPAPGVRPGRSGCHLPVARTWRRGYHHVVLQFQLVGEHWTLAGWTNGSPLLYR
jgi:hypothetical protein